MQNSSKTTGFFSFLFLSILIGCSNPNEKAQEIVDETLKVAGSHLINHKEIEFLFRDREYGGKFDDGKYEYVRLFKDSSKLIRDVLNNEGFYREVNGDRVDVIDSMATKYRNSVNSVLYFALIPKSLNDDAVIKEYLGTSQINDVTYHEIKVTFEQQGGGQDYSDVFVYWINANTNKIDYFGYSYETDGGGIRFRKAKNERYVEGIRFVDYDNYSPKKDIEVHELDEAFQRGDMKLVSEIVLENILVNDWTRSDASQ